LVPAAVPDFLAAVPVELPAIGSLLFPPLGVEGGGGGGGGGAPYPFLLLISAAQFLHICRLLVMCSRNLLLIHLLFSIKKK
jgi:hypothetical protein